MLFSIGAYGIPLWFPQGSNTAVGGYLEDFPYLTFSTGDTEPDFNNLLQLRLNTTYYPVDFLTFELAGRFQLYSGGQFSFNDSTRQLSTLLSEDRGYADLTKSWPSILYANIDRAWAGFNRGNLNVTLGRQRINWGTNFVWNPNDWFNTYNYLDFYYKERPGTDALRVQYYTGVTSVAELVLEAGKKLNDRTFASLYKFNTWNYDFQIQAGLFDLDAAAGFSWAGQIGGAGFRGEVAYFHPVLNQSSNKFIGDDTTGKVVAGISGGYTFPNSLYLNGEFLYNGYGTRGPIDMRRAQLELSAKNLLPSTFGLFTQLSYTFTPLLQGTLAASMNPDDYSFYVAPSLTWSVVDNIDFMVIAQLFSGAERTLYGSFGDLAALSIKWSFGS